MRKIIFQVCLFLAAYAISMAQDPVAITGRPWEKMSRDEHRKFWEKRTINLYEPSGAPSIEKLGHYILVFKDSNVYDAKSTVFDVKAEDKEGTVTLSGEVLVPEHKDGIERTLRVIGFEKIQNDIAVLPSPQLGKLGFAVVTSDTLSIKRFPQHLSEQLNQAAKGAPLRLLKPSPDEKYFLLQSADGYIGWANASDIKRMTLEEWTQVRKIENDDIAMSEKIKNIVRPIMGIPYVWGGTSNAGMDCSGFTQFVYRELGIFIPRDADQQSNVGELVAFRDYMHNLRAGDLLFFAGGTGRISHVAISLGKTEYLQSTNEEGVHYSSFAPDSYWYDERTAQKFIFARRILKDGF